MNAKEVAKVLLKKSLCKHWTYTGPGETLAELLCFLCSSDGLPSDLASSAGKKDTCPGKHTITQIHTSTKHQDIFL